MRNGPSNGFIQNTQEQWNKKETAYNLNEIY
jgi:hypothetical protein